MHVEVLQHEKLKYIVRYPDGYKNGVKYPVIIFLHGAGTRGNDIEILKANPYFQMTEQHSHFPFITVAPHCSENTWFDMFEQLTKLAVKVSNEDFADEKRIYLMGASMGGYATWQLAMSLPQLFAAIVPVCGGGMYWNAGRLKNIPVWAFHGEKDNVVKCEESIKMVDKVNECGGNARLTVYPENSHDAWSDTYSNYEVFKWLLGKENTLAEKSQDNFKDSSIYG